MAVIIEARLNELANRQRNRHVPYTADEIVRDAVACAEAGASIVHFHARDAAGEPVQHAEVYADIIRRIRERCDILIHPSLGYATVDPDPEQRFRVIRDLAGDPCTKPDFAPMDVGTANVDIWDEASARFETTGRIYRNSTADLIVFAKGAAETGIKPYLFCWNIGFSRQADRLLRMGLVARPAFAALVMTGDRIAAAHPGTEAGLEAHLAFLPGGAQTVWSACVVGASIMPLVPMIVARGGHVAAGLGDHHHADNAEPHNADVIAHLGDVIRRHGASVASTEEARRLLSLA